MDTHRPRSLAQTTCQTAKHLKLHGPREKQRRIFFSPWGILVAGGEQLPLSGSILPRGGDLYRASGEVTSDTHLQHLGVIEDLVLVAALTDRKDVLGEVGAFI